MRVGSCNASLGDPPMPVPTSALDRPRPLGLSSSRTARRMLYELVSSFPADSVTQTPYERSVTTTRPPSIRRQ
jgi:hypothetical protein